MARPHICGSFHIFLLWNAIWSSLLVFGIADLSDRAWKPFEQFSRFLREFTFIRILLVTRQCVQKSCRFSAPRSDPRNDGPTREKVKLADPKMQETARRCGRIGSACARERHKRPYLRRVTLPRLTIKQAGQDPQSHPSPSSLPPPLIRERETEQSALNRCSV